MWNGPNIVVFRDVTIKPPYKVENMSGQPGSRQFTYIKKVVEKFAADQALAASQPATSSPPSSVAPTAITSNVTAAN